MTDTPVVSAVIPTFGRPALVERAVRSALAQTLGALEVIVVIDGDDPASRDRLAAIGDPRLRVISHPAKRGPGAARDTGADAAAGKWVAFLDDDDEWLPTKLERQVEAAGDARTLVTTLSYVTTPDATYVRPLQPYTPDRPIDEWLFDRTTWLKGGLTFLQTSSLMLPRALFDHQHFSDSHQHEDWELVIRAMKEHGYGLVTVKEPLTVHYVDTARPSLSKQRTWQHSLAWVEGLGPLITPRAYSGFVFNEIGRATAEAGMVSALPTLVSRAFRRGKPTAKQVFRFALGMAAPRAAKHRIRAAFQSVRPGARAEG